MIQTITSALNQRRALVGLVLFALVLRLAFVLLLDPHPDFSGGDTNWYMRTGRHLVVTGTTDGPIQTAPLYPIFVGAIQVLVPGWPQNGEYYTYPEMQVVRILQCILGALLVVFAFIIGQRWISARAGWIAAVVMAISPALIIQAGIIASENLFLFFMLGALALYALVHQRLTWRWAAVAGVVFGLATLTRAVFLLFPLGIALHLLITQRARWRQYATSMLLCYSAMVGTWTVYNLIVWDRFIIGGEGVLSFIDQGIEGKASPQEYDAGLGLTVGAGHEDRLSKIKARIKDNIMGDPLGWITHRAKELGYSYVQPHNTNHFAGESIRYAAQDWLLEDRSLEGFRDLFAIESFWPKLAIYVFHFGALALGLGGMIILRHRWRDLLPLYGVVIYFTGVHLLLLALPRYLFPMYPAFSIFAAGFIARAWDMRRSGAQDHAHVVYSTVKDSAS